MEEAEESLHTAFAAFLLLLDSYRVCGCAVARHGYLSRVVIGISMAVTVGRGFLFARPPTTLLILHLLLLLLLLRMVIVLFELTAVAALRPRTAQRSDHSDGRNGFSQINPIKCRKECIRDLLRSDSESSSFKGDCEEAVGEQGSTSQGRDTLSLSLSTASSSLTLRP